MLQGELPLENPLSASWGHPTPTDQSSFCFRFPHISLVVVPPESGGLVGVNKYPFKHIPFKFTSNARYVCSAQC